MWISTVTLPNPEEDDVSRVLEIAIKDLSETGQALYDKPLLLPVEAEWTGYREGVSKDAPQPIISEAEKFINLMREVKSNVTVLYFHGGAYYLMDPASHRGITVKLAKLTNGRVFSVRYRLAPQHPFPAALLDCLLAYLSLLYPPPGSLHAPVKPEHIVFAGDSAGGNMCLVLIQMLLHIQRTSSTSPPIYFHGKKITLPLPAGIATDSAWCDMTRSMPSLHTNAKFDYIPPPDVPTSTQMTSVDSQHPTDPLNKHPCTAWPATPPRCDLYCDGSMLCHPLVSPLAATAESWTGAPPMFFCVGEEMLADEIRIVARRCAKAGVKVRWEGFEAMPHVFAMLLEGLRRVRLAFVGGRNSSVRWWRGRMIRYQVVGNGCRPRVGRKVLLIWLRLQSWVMRRCGG